MKTIPIIISILLLFSFTINGQNQYIDSLRNVLNKLPVKSDTNAINLHYDILSELINIAKYEEASKEIELMYKLSLKKNFTIGILKSKYAKANIHYFNSENEKALALFDEIESEINDKNLGQKQRDKFMSPIYASMGNIYDYYSDYGKALEYHIKAMNISKALGNENNYAVALGSIANIYERTNDLEESIEYHKKAIEIKKKVNSPYSLGLSYYNLSQVFDKMKNYQMAIDMLNKSENYAEKANDAIGIALCNRSLGLIYVSLSDLSKNDSLMKLSKVENELLKNKNLLSKAYAYINKAINILESVDDIHYISHAYSAMGTVLGNQDNYKESVAYYLKSYKISEGRDITGMKIASEGLYEVNKKAKNYEQSLIWHEKYLEYKDSINSEEKQKEIGKRQAELTYIKTKEISDLKHKTEIDLINHENEKKQLIAKNEQRKQRYVILTIAIGLIIIGLFLIIMIRRWKITKAQKEVINHQKELIEKEKLATEDSISYAKNIQKAAFPSLNEVNAVIPNNFILFKPKDIVSGDFYWANQINNKKFIALADCTGHGVPGAFMTLISLNILNQIIADGVETPQGILQQLHLRLQKRLSKTSKHGLDLAICMIEDNKLTYSGVHIPLYHIRNGNLLEFKGQKFQLGSDNSILFQQHEITLLANDSFYISTDGFPDQKGGPKGKKYYYPTLRDKLTSIVSLDLENQKIELNNEFNNWKGKHEQLDDVSVIGFKI